MPIYHKQKSAELIEASHEVCRVLANILGHIPGLHQQLHSCDVEYLADTSICGCLYSAEQLFGVLFELVHIDISNSRTAIGFLRHCCIATLPVNIFLCLLRDIEHVAFWIIAVRTFQCILQHQLSHFRHNIILPYNMQSRLLSLHRFCLAGGIGHHILSAFGVYLDLIIVLALVVVQRKLDGLNCAALQLRQFCLTPTISILAVSPLLGEAGREHDTCVLRYSYRFICHNRTYNVGVCNMHCFIIVRCPGLTCTDVLQ